jgi:hypothetical protein
LSVSAAPPGVNLLRRNIAYGALQRSSSNLANPALRSSSY